MTHSRIVGTGGYLPNKILTNLQLESMVDTTDAWIVERTGIRQRHIAEGGETTANMGYFACLKALESAQLQAEDVDLIVVATCTPDLVFPSTACLIQEKLKIKKTVIAFDITAACAGFVYALNIADELIKSGQAKRALVVGSEVMSKAVDWNDRTTCVLFGDGAGAVLLQASQEPGIQSKHLYAQGQLKDILSLPNPYWQNEEKSYLRMNGAEVFKFAVRSLEHSIPKTLAEAKMSLNDLNWLVPHQANIRILQLVAKKMEIPMDKMIITMDKQGNTSAASIPLAIDEGVRSGRIKSGHSVLLEGFGGGMAWGSMLLTM